MFYNSREQDAGIIKYNVLAYNLLVDIKVLIFLWFSVDTKNEIQKYLVFIS